MKKKLVIGLMVFCSVFLISFYAIFKTVLSPLLLSLVEQNISKDTRNITSELVKALSTPSITVENISQLMERIPLNREILIQTIEPLILSSTLNLGGGIWPEPFQLNQNKELSSLFWVVNNGTTLINDGYNKTNTSPYYNESWYINAKNSINDNQCIWSEPYIDSITNNHMTTCSKKIIRDGKFWGVATLDVSLAFISDLMRSLNSNGFNPFIITKSGILLSELELNGQNYFMTPIRDIKWGDGVIKTLTSMNSGIHHLPSNDNNILITNVIPSNEWTIGILTSKNIAFNVLDNINTTISTMLISFTIIILIITIYVYQWTNRNVLIPIGGEPEDISNLVQHVANGDLTISVETNGNETGIYHNVLVMISNLRSMVEKINIITVSLNSSSKDLTTSAAIISNSSKSANHQLEQTATAMNEMTVTVDEVARSAVSASDAANNANTNSISGLAVIDDMNNSIRALVTNINNISHVIQNVEHETESIGGILDVIRSIADQTNLLALNAAIEAARAGEQGRGFAVVADEVRNLASRTQQCTEEIQVMITKLQSESKKSVQLMTSNTNDAEITASKTHETHESLSEILVSVSVINDMNCQIATAAEEQSHVAVEINRSIVQISDSSNKSHNETDQTSKLASELNIMAIQLDEIVSQFKLK